MLSSTPLVIKFLQSSKDKEVSADSECGSLLLGMLVMQDIQLGLIIACLPVLARHVEKKQSFSSVTATLIVVKKCSIERPDGYIFLSDIFLQQSVMNDMFSVFTLLMEIIVSMALVLLVAYIIGRHLIQTILKWLITTPKEIQMLGSAAIMYIMLLFTNMMGLSMELGCFVSGVLIATSAGQHTNHIIELLEPLKDLFSTFFFTSIGFHVFPSFVVYEITILLWLTFLIVSIKFSVSAIVLRAILPPSTQHIKVSEVKGILVPKIGTFRDQTRGFFGLLGPFRVTGA